MESAPLFIAFKADDLPKHEAALFRAGEPDKLRAHQQAMESADRQWRGWAQETGGDVLSIGAGKGVVRTTAEHLHALHGLLDSYRKATGSRVSAGVGTKMDQAETARQVAEHRGSDRVVLHQPGIEHELKPQAPDELAAVVERVAKAEPEPQQPLVVSNIADLLHQHADAQEAKDAAEDKEAAEIQNARAKVAQILQQIRQEAPNYGVLRQTAPGAYQAYLALIQGVIQLAQALPKPEMKKTEEEIGVIVGELAKMEGQVFSASMEDPEYSVEALVEHATKHLPVQQVPVQKLLQSAKQTQTDEPWGSPEFASRSARADMRYPLTLVQHPKHGLMIADGMHRLYQHVQKGATHVPAYVIPHDQLETAERNWSKYAGAKPFARASTAKADLTKTDEDDRADALHGISDHIRPGQSVTLYSHESQQYGGPQGQHQHVVRAHPGTISKVHVDPETNRAHLIEVQHEGEGGRIYNVAPLDVPRGATYWSHVMKGNDKQNLVERTQALMRGHSNGNDLSRGWLSMTFEPWAGEKTDQQHLVPQGTRQYGYGDGDALLPRGKAPLGWQMHKDEPASAAAPGASVLPYAEVRRLAEHCTKNAKHQLHGHAIAARAHADAARAADREGLGHEVVGMHELLARKHVAAHRQHAPVVQPKPGTSRMYQALKKDEEDEPRPGQPVTLHSMVPFDRGHELKRAEMVYVRGNVGHVHQVHHKNRVAVAFDDDPNHPIAFARGTIKHYQPAPGEITKVHPNGSVSVLHQGTGEIVRFMQHGNNWVRVGYGSFAPRAAAPGKPIETDPAANTHPNDETWDYSHLLPEEMQKMGHTLRVESRGGDMFTRGVHRDATGQEIGAQWKYPHSNAQPGSGVAGRPGATDAPEHEALMQHLPYLRHRADEALLDRVDEEQLRSGVANHSMLMERKQHVPQPQDEEDQNDPARKSELAKRQVEPHGTFQEGGPTGTADPHKVGKIKVKNADGKTMWKEVRAGMIAATNDRNAAPIIGQSSHPTSVRNRNSGM